jgi:hypothetical protein
VGGVAVGGVAVGGVAVGCAGADGAGMGLVYAGGCAAGAGCVVGAGAGVATVAGAGAAGAGAAGAGGGAAGAIVVVRLVVRVVVDGGGEVVGGVSAGGRGIVVIGCGPVSSGFFGAVTQQRVATCGGFAMPVPVASGARATRSGAGSSLPTGGGFVGPGAVDSPSGNCNGSDGGTRGPHAQASNSAQTRTGDMPSGGCERHAA